MTPSNASCNKEFRIGTNYVGRVTIAMGQGEQFISAVLQIAAQSDQNNWSSATMTLQIDGTYATSAGYPPAGADPPYVYRIAITYIGASGQTLTTYYPNPPEAVGGPPGAMPPTKRSK